jgi:hypothetical protein
MRSEFEWAIDELEQIIIEEHNERKRW